MINLHSRQYAMISSSCRDTWKIFFWISFAIFGILIALELRSILLPFITGIAVAYFLDPLADYLEQMGCTRTFATLIIITAFFLVLTVIGILFIPLLLNQIWHLTSHAPSYYDLFLQRLGPTLRQLIAKLDPTWQEHLTETIADFIRNATSWIGLLAAHIWNSSVALLWLVSLILVTPLVTFYLLRDWDQIMIQIDSLLPRKYYDTIRYLVNEIDYTMAGLARGQAIVCLILGIFYAVSLTIVVGLDTGLIIGFITGLISLAPYIGAVIGFILSTWLSIIQFGTWKSVVLTLAVFGIGQILEGNILTPKLVGERIGLHPVWIVFSLLSGSTLFGFVGILFAVPIAAILGVFIRFSLHRYLDSSFYN